MAEKCKSSCVKKVFISGIVKNNRINDFIIQEVSRNIYDDCQKEDNSFILSMMVSVVTISSKMVFIYWIVVNKV